MAPHCFILSTLLKRLAAEQGSFTLSAAGLFLLFYLERLLSYCTPGISMVSGPVIPIEASTIYPFQKMGV